MKWIGNNDNDDKYSNDRHISIEIINSEKTETTCYEYRLYSYICTLALNKY